MNDVENNNVVEGEFTDLEKVSRQPAQLVRNELTPDGLRAEIAKQTEMRSIMTDYVKGQMVDGHHYYSFNKLGKAATNSNIKADKPALTQDGAHLIMGLFRCIPGPVKQDIIRHDDGHFTVVSEAPVYNQEGALIATGNGSASTRESKYAYRWVYDRDVPKDVDRSTLQTRSGTNWTQYRLPNTDLADQENTMIKMSAKRATVGAVRKLPLVSELFASDPNEATDDDQNDVTKSAPKAANPRSSKSATAAPATATAPTIVETAVNLSTKLQKDYGMSFDDLATQFLPEGKAKFSNLSADEAEQIVPALSELLNSKVTATRAAA